MSYVIIDKMLFHNLLYAGVSAEAKLLYSFLLDRRKLSEKNGDVWLHENGEIFVYFPLAEICTLLGCGHDKASRLLSELQKANLIQCLRQGLGKPNKLFVKPVVQISENQNRTALKNSPLESDKFDSNNTYSNHLDNNTTESTLLCDRALIETRIKENVYYDILAAEIDNNLLDTVITVIVETLSHSAKTVRISGQQICFSEVYDRFMSLNDMHLRYAVEKVKLEEHTIYSPKGYILRTLFYADQEMEIYYISRVTQDDKKHRV